MSGIRLTIGELKEILALIPEETFVEFGGAGGCLEFQRLKGNSPAAVQIELALPSSRVLPP